MAAVSAGIKPRRTPMDPDLRRAQAMRSCLGRFPTGVTVVTFEGPDGRHGLTVNAFTSVSLRPPLILVSIARSAHAHDALRGRPFCVNVLAAEQEALARRFAGGGLESAVEWWEGNGAPRLEGALAHLECAPWRTYDGGDHSLFLGEVIDFAHRDGDALAYLASRFTAVPEPTFGLEYLI